MADRVDKKTRHKIMAANRSKDTSPEIEIRKALFHRGFRYRLHVQSMIGNPDIVLPSKRAVIFVHGCFWHGHDCKRKPKAKSNRSFWKKKIERNKLRHREVCRKLIEKDWRVLVVWECAVRRRTPPFSESEDFEKVISWINGKSNFAVLSESGFDLYPEQNGFPG